MPVLMSGNYQFSSDCTLLSYRHCRALPGNWSALRLAEPVNSWLQSPDNARKSRNERSKAASGTSARVIQIGKGKNESRRPALPDSVRRAGVVDRRAGG